MYTKLSLFFLLSVLTGNSIQSMKNTKELDYIKTNKQFLTTFLKGKNKEKCAQDLQLLLTGLLVQDRYFIQAKKVAIETEKGNNLNERVIENNKKISQTIISEHKITGMLGESGTQTIMQFNPQTKECAKNMLLFAEHSTHFCTKACDFSEIEKRIENHKDKNSETVAFLESILLRKDTLHQMTRYQKVYNETDNFLYKMSTKIDLQNLAVNNDYLEKKINYFITAITKGTSYANDFNSFAPHKKELRDLYKQAKEKLENSIKPTNNKKKSKNKLKKYLNTTEHSPAALPKVLPENSTENWISGHIINFEKQKSKNPSKKTLNRNVNLLERISYLHDYLCKENEPHIEFSNSILEKNNIICCEDGSFTCAAGDDEIVIKFPKTKTTITLYAMNTQKYPVTSNLQQLPSAQNIKQWSTSPEEALFLQGYTNPQHDYYQPLPQEQNRMIYIHTLPEEIKKYIEKYAQQTRCKSRKYENQEDIQITFCGELTYPNGKTETGLFIYLVDTKTNTIYHQMFAESTYKKTFDVYLQQGNFNNALEKVFFPSLN